jgi:PleD family two-component response regulator
LQQIGSKPAILRGTILAEGEDMSRSGRILVVDDEVNARTALAELLRDEGFEVETAADAFKALGKYEAFTPHIVVTDLKMPGILRSVTTTWGVNASYLPSALNASAAISTS